MSFKSSKDSPYPLKSAIIIIMIIAYYTISMLLALTLINYWLLYSQYSNTNPHNYYSRTWWRIGRDDALRPEARGFESRSSRHVHIRTIRKSFTHTYLSRF